MRAAEEREAPLAAWGAPGCVSKHLRPGSPEQLPQAPRARTARTHPGRFVSTRICSYLSLFLCSSACGRWGGAWPQERTEGAGSPPSGALGAGDGVRSGLAQGGGGGRTGVRRESTDLQAGAEARGLARVPRAVLLRARAAAPAAARVRLREGRGGRRAPEVAGGLCRNGRRAHVGERRARRPVLARSCVRRRRVRGSVRIPELRAVRVQGGLRGCQGHRRRGRARDERLPAPVARRAGAASRGALEHLPPGRRALRRWTQRSLLLRRARRGVPPASPRRERRRGPRRGGVVPSRAWRPRRAHVGPHARCRSGQRGWRARRERRGRDRRTRLESGAARERGRVGVLCHTEAGSRQAPCRPVWDRTAYRRQRQQPAASSACSPGTRTATPARF